MIEAKLCDIPDIIRILEGCYGEGTLGPIEPYLSAKLRFRIDNNYLLNEDKDMMVIFERAGVYKCQFHTYSLKKKSLSTGIKFFKECLSYIKSIQNYTCFMTFVPEGNKAADMAARVVGCEKIGDIPNAGGDSYETLYILQEV